MRTASTHIDGLRFPMTSMTPPAGFAELYERHYEAVFRAALRVTGNPADAEDVLQTVFLRLVRREDSLELAPSPGAYLHRAAVNAALDLMRGRARSRAVSFESVEPTREFTSSDLNPEEAHAENQLRARVREAVARLGGRAATTFALRYFEGYDNREIAEMLGTSQMVVAVTLHRARTRLKKEIGEYLER